MHFDDALWLAASVLVQAVEILCDDAEQDAHAFQLNQRAVCRVRFRGCHLPRKGTARLPVLLPRLWFRNKIVVADRRLLQPDGAGAAKVWNTRFGADASARQHHDALRRLYQLDGIM